MIDFNGISTKKLHTAVALISFLLFIPFLGNVHLFDWDEINFAEAAREMIVTGNWLRVQIDFQPFWEKPPLFIWLQAISMSVFGMNEFAARLPNALIGVVTLQVLLYIGRTLRNTQFALWWAVAYAASFLPHFYFRSGIIDPLFNTFIFCGIWFLYRWYVNSSTLRNVIYAGICTGLAILTKGPVGLLIPSLVLGVFLILKIKDILSTLPSILLYLLTTIIVSSLWFGVEYMMNGSWFIEEFVRYQIRLLTTGDAGHSQPWFYHFLVVLIGCFPASVLAVFAIRNGWKDSITFTRWMMILLAVVLLVFSIVKTKIVHYSSLTYFPVTYLAAITIVQLCNKERKSNRSLLTLYSFLNVVWLFLFSLLCYIGFNIEKILAITKGKFEKANLSAPVHWNGFEVVVPTVILLGFVSFLFFVKRDDYYKALVSSFSSTLLATLLFLPLVAPNIEGYTQRSIINFYEQTQKENSYVQPIFYKTYAHLFYGRRKYEQSPSFSHHENGGFEEWLKMGKIDKPVYFIAKINDKHHLDEIPEAKFYGDYYGFLVYKRLPPIKDSL